MVEREYWGNLCNFRQVVREGITEACTNYVKEGREQATFISGKRATEEHTADANASGRNICGMLATPIESQRTCLRVSKRKVPEVRQVIGLGAASMVELCRPLSELHFY